LREKEYLKGQYAGILSSVGLMLLLSSAVMLSPLLVLPIYPQETSAASAFVFPAFFLGLIGLMLKLGFRRSSAVTLSVKEGGVIVLISWITVILFSAWPFVSIVDMDFSQAVFESVSGWTTTGLTIVDVSSASRMILVWRSVMQLAGGAGLAIIMMSAIVGSTGPGISNAEGRSDQLVPEVRRSARLVLTVYCGYALAGTLAYWLTGMSPFDALNHSFAAVSTGGFSTHVESIGYWDSAAIEAVSLPLMLLGNLSFVTAWFLLRGRFRFVARNGETRLLALLVPVSAGLLFTLTCRGFYPHLSKSLRVAVFEAVSALTTTGFSTVGYEYWNGFGFLVLILLMLIGGGTCSTAGGIKQFRVYLLWKSLTWEVKRWFLPRTAVMKRPAWGGDRWIFVDDARVRRLSVFVFLYLTTYVFGAGLLSACGYPLRDSLFEFSSAIGTVGLSVGVTSSSMPNVVLWAMVLGMFFGRLEFMVIIVSLLKLFRDGRRLMMSR